MAAASAMEQSPQVNAASVLERVSPLLQQAEAMRVAQRRWAATPMDDRLRCLRRFRQTVAKVGGELADMMANSAGRTRADTLSVEVIPLLEASRFLERNAAELLRPQRLSKRDRPDWLKGVDVETVREALGLVLVIGPFNYPLFLPGVQALQALAAGNAVIWKPGRGGFAVAEWTRERLIRAGLPHELLTVTEESTAAAEAWLDSGAIDKVAITGSVTSGRSVLKKCAETITPVTPELSGCDAAIVLKSANVTRAAQAIAFGLRLNQGATCIAPRRIFVEQRVANAFSVELKALVEREPRVKLRTDVAQQVIALVRDAQAKGAELLTGDEPDSSGTMPPTLLRGGRSDMAAMAADVFAPFACLLEVESAEEAIRQANDCPYALGASVFGKEGEASSVAGQLDAGVVVVNDMVAPTADPRVSFGGRRHSGYGKTRGAEGLLEMTVTKCVVRQTSKRLRHLEAPHPQAATIFESYMALRHGAGLREKTRAAAGLVRAAMQRS